MVTALSKARLRAVIVRATMLLFAVSSSTSCDDDTAVIQPPVVTGKFRNPVLPSAPDPWVVRRDSLYYFTHTTGNRIILYRTTDMSALDRAEQKIVWTAPTEGANSKNIWAPEVHYLNGRWFFYYAADDGNNENHRMWVLENTSADPFTGTWIDRGQLPLPDNQWAIDGSVFETHGQLYFVWSGWQSKADQTQGIYVVKMSDPLSPVGERKLLSRPGYTWESIGGPPAVNEAPQYLQHGNKQYLVYSSSGCWTDDYALGMLSTDVSNDPITGTWDKSALPVFSKYPEGGAFGPGHCAFFTSPDGTENWMLYHANSLSGDGCGDERSTRMQAYTWSADTIQFGMPAALDVWLDKPAGN